MAHTLPPHPLDISCDPHLAKALAVLDALGPEGIERLRRPMGVLVYRLGKLLCAAEAPTLPVGALLAQDLEASLHTYPALKWQEPGLREAMAALTQVLADLGRYCNEAAHAPGPTDTRNTWGSPLPFLPLYRALGAFAVTFPVRPDSRCYETQPGEESVLHAGGDDKPKVRGDAQRSFATLLDACDYQVGFWQAPFKSELAHAANGMPFIGTPAPRPARKGDCHWRKPKGSLSADLVVVPPGHPSPCAARVTHAVELKLTPDSLGLNQSQALVDMFGRDRFHVLHAPGMRESDHLPAPELQRWIDALRSDAGATATVPASDASGPSQPPATWRLAMFASAYFHIRSKADGGRLALLIPQLHEEFQALTGHALTRYMGLRSGAVSRRAHTQADIETHFLRHADDIVSLEAFDAQTKESSSQFEFQALAQCRRARLAKAAPGLDYLTLHFPLAFWNARKDELRAWWLGALQRLQPVQASMGLGIGRPPVLERYAFQQVAEFALAQRFLGLDVDKPFFMRSSRPDGMSLEHGMRTPSFGVLVCGDFATKLGGVDALQGRMRKVPGLRVQPCMEGRGLWIEAGEAPALYPVEEGVPKALRALAEALKPVRLQRLWMVSYPPNVARDDMFTPDTSARWLRRFDADGDWPGTGPTTGPSASPAAG